MGPPLDGARFKYYCTELMLDFEQLRLIVNSLIPEVSISQECLEGSSNIASSSELDKERTRELVYYTTCLYT